MEESEEATALLKAIGDFERISDHAVNVLESAEELRGKQLAFSRSAQAEFDTLSGALREILELTLEAFEKHDAAAAAHVEPLEEVIDALKEQMRTRHILRMQQGNCSIEAGFVWSDLLTNLERTSDHCSNIAGCIIDTAQHNLNLHESLGLTKRESESFRSMFRGYAKNTPCRRWQRRKKDEKWGCCKIHFCSSPFSITSRWVRGGCKAWQGRPHSSHGRPC